MPPYVYSSRGRAKGSLAAGKRQGKAPPRRACGRREGTTEHAPFAPSALRAPGRPPSPLRSEGGLAGERTALPRGDARTVPALHAMGIPTGIRTEFGSPLLKPSPSGAAPSGGEHGGLLGSPAASSCRAGVRGRSPCRLPRAERRGRQSGGERRPPGSGPDAPGRPAARSSSASSSGRKAAPPRTLRVRRRPIGTTRTCPG
jgi:hypothetical protein